MHMVVRHRKHVHGKDNEKRYMETLGMNNSFDTTVRESPIPNAVATPKKKGELTFSPRKVVTDPEWENLEPASKKARKRHGRRHSRNRGVYRHHPPEERKEVSSVAS